MTSDATQALLDLAAALAENTAAVRENTAARKQAPTGRSVAPHSGGSGAPPTTFPAFGRGSGKPIRDASRSDLDYYGDKARKGAAEKAGWKRDNDVALVEAIDAEIARQSGGGQGQATFGDPPPDFGSPPPDDNDIPFVATTGAA